MSEKPKPSKAPSTWRGKRPADPHYGEMRPISVQPSAGFRLGNWLYGLLTPWKR